MASPRAIARALARSERAQVKAAIKAGDELGYNRNYTRGLVKFGSEGMTPEARLARAREMGFDTDTPLYRGMNRPPNNDVSRTYNGDFLSPDPEIASGWGGTNQDYRMGLSGGNVNRVFAKPPSETIDWGGRSYDNEPPSKPGYWLDKYVREFSDNGGDIARIDNVRDHGGRQTQYFVADPTARRSTQATFDPARANRRDLLAGVVPATAALGAGALAMQPQEAEAATPGTALARALARSFEQQQALGEQSDAIRMFDRVANAEQRRALQATGGRVDRSGAFVRQMATPEGLNYLADTALDAAGWVDPSGGFATETVRAFKDLTPKVGLGGAVAMAPMVGASELNGGIGQLPFVAYEAAKSSPRAIARALARAPQPRGSQTYRKAK